MSFARILGLTLVSLALVACGTPPRMQSAQPRTPDGGEYMLARSALLDVTNHVTQHLDKDRNIVYFQNFGGGGAGLGIFLGPLGVAANMSMIEGNTKKDVARLQDRIAVRPVEIFSEVARRQGLVLASTATDQAPRVTPYLYVSKTEGETLLLSSAFVVEQGGGPDKWTGKFFYQLPQKYTIDALAQLNDGATAELREAVAAGYSQLITHMGSETDASLSQEKKIMFKSDLLNPRFDFEMAGSLIADQGDMVWIRTFGGVYGLRKQHVSYVVQKS